MLSLLLTVVPGLQAEEQGGYTPPAGTPDVSGLMGGSGNHDYSLGALMVQQGSAGTNGSGVSSGHGSVLDGMGSGSASSSSTAVRKALRAENRKLKAQVMALTGEMRSLQDKVVSASDPARLAEMTARLAERDKKLAEQDALIASLKATSARLEHDNLSLLAGTGSLEKAKSDLKAVQTQLKLARAELSTVRAGLLQADNARAQLESTLLSTRSQLARANERAAAAGKVAAVPLDSGARKEAYVVGQAMASGLRERLSEYAASGVELDLARVNAGLNDGLRSKMQLPRGEMDKVYQSFARRLQMQVTTKVKEGEALLAKQLAGRKPAKTVAGISYVVVKKGKAIKDSDAPLALALTERMVEGKTLSTIPRLTLGPDDDMPAIVREALPLLGEGAEVEAYALAKSVYGTLPLPKGVAAYTVLVYRMTGLKAG
ncbi:FKBP-type peptidyl-prolyl cis-trans isomerase N-terminal domain-containing protein [Serratia marcescens]|uniref:FKBP-type peptidyl-prolyl cis-trans isomerase N-terminal domain-containing protein n=1 Tax=Serratia marcescens TaxID=615 RepID=UPI0015C57B2B|nr:FKBP-type peptidyl-prolyl cis-trans isomerase N-terminal domain-containing protein [Serratia marcescens]